MAHCLPRVFANARVLAQKLDTPLPHKRDSRITEPICIVVCLYVTRLPLLRAMSVIPAHSSTSAWFGREPLTLYSLFLALVVSEWSTTTVLDSLDGSELLGANCMHMA